MHTIVKHMKAIGEVSLWQNLNMEDINMTKNPERSVKADTLKMLILNIKKLKAGIEDREDND